MSLSSQMELNFHKPGSKVKSITISWNIKTLDETNEIESLRVGYSEGAFVTVKVYRPREMTT